MPKLLNCAFSFMREAGFVITCAGHTQTSGRWLAARTQLGPAAAKAARSSSWASPVRPMITPAAISPAESCTAERWRYCTHRDIRAAAARRSTRRQPSPAMNTGTQPRQGSQLSRACVGPCTRGAA